MGSSSHVWRTVRRMLGDHAVGHGLTNMVERPLLQCERRRGLATLCCLPAPKRDRALEVAHGRRDEAAAATGHIEPHRRDALHNTREKVVQLVLAAASASASIGGGFPLPDSAHSGAPTLRRVPERGNALQELAQIAAVGARALSVGERFNALADLSLGGPEGHDPGVVRGRVYSHRDFVVYFLLCESLSSRLF